MIKQAILKKGELTVSGIYQWISENFPFYKPNDNTWKNSVRHTLTTNPRFMKGARGSRSPLWTLATKNENFQSTLETRRQSFTPITTPYEVDRVTGNIEKEENEDLPREVLLSIPEEGTSSYPFPDFNYEQLVSLEQSTEEILSRIKKNAEVQDLTPQAETTFPIEIDSLKPVPMEVAEEELRPLEDMAWTVI
ncbi:forkhead box C1-A-like [Zootermopsis nevadensis]|uniref:forkhead box C1-A-like n=1 Tax=Zootermopsis nevadensis TaxID=136037 RepID=UPI000B8E8122|nr:forkhead box C1-A-like [Zootermopsis nevadensis]